MSNINEILNNVVEKFQEGIAALGPNVQYAWEQIINHTVIHSVMALISVCILAIISYTILIRAWKNLKNQVYIQNSSIFEVFHPVFWVSFFFSIFITISLSFSLATNIPKIIYPEGYLLKELISGNLIPSKIK